MKVKVLSLSAVLTLCKPMDCSPPNSSVHRILQARILKWLAIPFSRASSRCKDWTHVSCIQFSSLAQSCLTLCNPMDCSTPGLPVHHQLRSLLKLRSIRSVMPSNHLILCCPLLLPPSTFPSIRVFSNESVLRIRWPQYWSFSFSISPSNEYSGLTSFRRTGWISLQSKGLARVFSNTTVQKHQFFGAQLSLQSNSHIHTWLLEKP